MALILNGSEGLSDVDGSASTPAIRGTDTNTGIFFPAADTIAFAEGGAEVARFDSSGNLGIGTSSPDNRLLVNGSLGVLNDSLQFRRTGETTWGMTNFASNLYFNNGSDRMVLDSSGNLLVGTTSSTYPSSGRTVINVNGSSQALFGMQVGGAAKGYILHDGTNIEFRNQGSGSINVYSGSSGGVSLAQNGTSWTSLSDERLKTDLKPITDAANKVSTLRAVTGRYKTDEEGVSRSFLIAQDIQAVLPEAVDVRDDEMGTLGVRYTDVIPLLTAAIKEQQAIITDLKSRLEVLEAK